MLHFPHNYFACFIIGATLQTSKPLKILSYIVYTVKHVPKVKDGEKFMLLDNISFTHGSLAIRTTRDLSFCCCCSSLMNAGECSVHAMPSL